MSERSNQIRVGVIFILAVIVLVAGVLWFKNFRISGRNVKATVEFPNTSGLVRGDPVEVSGVPSGQVSQIRYEDGRALVTLDLNRKVKLFRGSRFVIENVGIMGQKLVAIYPRRDAETSKISNLATNILVLVCGVPNIDTASLSNQGTCPKLYCEILWRKNSCQCEISPLISRLRADF